MKAAPLPEIKKELNTLSSTEIQELCLRLARYKKENKELLSYLLFELHHEDVYIENVKNYMDEAFSIINISSFFYIRKSVRKILKTVKKHIRYSQKKETEIDLLIYFCKKLKDFKPSISHSTQLQNMYKREKASYEKIISTLHEDLQYDYGLILKEL